MISDHEGEDDNDFERYWALPPKVALEKTSVDDLIGLTNALLGKETTRAALERVGAHGDFSEEEEAAIDRAIADHSAGKGWGLRDHVLLPLAVTLARWVAAGALPSVDSQEARAFIEDRYFERQFNLDGFRTKRPSVEEVLWVARQLKKDPFYWNELAKAGDGYVDRKALKRMYAIENEALLKYGLRNRNIDAIGVLRDIVLGKVPDLDSPEAVARIRFHNNPIRD